MPTNYNGWALHLFNPDDELDCIFMLGDESDTYCLENAHDIGMFLKMLKANVDQGNE